MQRSLGIPLVLVVELAVAVVLVVPVLAHHLAAHVVVLPLVLLVLLVPVARVPAVPLVVVVALLLVVATALAVVPLVPVALSTLVRVVVVAGSRLDAHVVARALPRDEAVRRGRPGATADELKHGSCCWSGRGERSG